jgi:hypothetical protein
MLMVERHIIMATQAQFEANRHNARLSTGPVTDTGKSTSARNALTLGLYTRTDYVKPEERDLYREFRETMRAELAPGSLLEESLTAEITGATWRLRRCSAAEADLADFARVGDQLSRDPLLDDTTEKTRRSIERARAGSTSLLHRGINQLRRLQKDRLNAGKSPQAPEPSKPIEQPKPPTLTKADLESLLEPPADFLANLDAILAEHAGKLPPGQLASICAAPATASARTAQTPRNAPCPCRSGEKFKRCCGRNAPPLLGKAA